VTINPFAVDIDGHRGPEKQPWHNRVPRIQGLSNHPLNPVRQTAHLGLDLADGVFSQSVPSRVTDRRMLRDDLNPKRCC
jgi:hypothetical protein